MPLHLMFARRVLLLCLLVPAAWLAGPSAARAQGVTLQGAVRDASNGQALVGANVVVQEEASGTVYGAVGNQDGLYQIAGIPPGRYVVQVTFVGYTTHRDTLALDGGEEVVTLSFRLRPRAEQIEEVVVTSERDGGSVALQAGIQRVRPADLARIPTPGPSGDLAGYLQTLPGVVALGDRGGQLFIRGGTPTQNLVLVDGMLMVQPFHIIGFFSAFPEDVISNVDVYAGGFGARYTGRLSSVIDVTLRGGNTQAYEGSASASPFLTGVRLEGPIRRGRTSVLASMRQSVVERTAPSLLGQELPLTFNDWMVRIHDQGDQSQCSATVMRTYDRGRIDASRDETFRWSNTVVGGQCAGFVPNSSVHAEANLALSYTGNAVGASVRPERDANAWRINADAGFTYLLAGGHKVGWGAYGRADNMGYNLAEQFQALRTDAHLLLEVGGYAEAEAALGDRLTLQPGVALTAPFDGGATLEPRFRMAWRPWGTRAQEFSAAFGLYRQTFVGVYDERDAGSVFTAWLPTPAGDAWARALHALAGWRQQIGPFGFSAEGYLKRVKNLPVPIWSTLARFTTTLSPADGDIYGFDTRVEVEAAHVYAYLGYGYSWIEYAAAQENFSLWFGEPVQRYHPPHDRRHQVNAVLHWNRGPFEASLRWQFGSGLPFTQPFGFDSMVFLPGLQEVPRDRYGTPRILYDRPYQGRLPTYHRLDVSVGYAPSLPVVDLTLQAGAINLYDRANLFYYDVFALNRVDQLPLTPYLALTVGFH